MQFSTGHSSHTAHPAAFLSSSMPFANLTGQASAQFNAMATEMSYTRGARLFTEEETPKAILVLTSGRVKLSVTSQEGKTVILRIAGAGDVLGVSAALTGHAYEMSAEAVEPCRARVIRAQDFVALLQRYPEASMEATRCVLAEYQATFSNMCRLALPTTVAGRLAKLLLEWLDDRLARGGENQRRLTVALTQEEIAGLTNTSRETVSRVLHQFQREKFIAVKGASLTVLQPSALQQLAT